MIFPPPSPPNWLRLKGANGTADRIGEVARIEPVVTHEFVSFPVPDVGAGACGDVHDRARIPAVLGTEGRIIDFGLFNRVDSGLERDLVVDWVAQVDPVNHVIDLIFPRTAGIERERALASQRRREEAAGGGSNAPRQKLGQIHEVTAVEGNFLDRPLIHHAADIHG